MNAGYIQKKFDALEKRIEEVKNDQIKNDHIINHILKTFYTKEEIDVTDLNITQILKAVAERRVETKGSIPEAAKSLNIDPRTLKGYLKGK